MALALVLVSIAASVAPAAAAASATTAPTEAFVITLHEDGSAQVALTFTFDLQTDADRTGFEAIRDDPENLTTTFHDRFVRLADRASATTGREMTVHDPTIDLETVDDRYGVVELAVTWEGIASTADDGLMLSEPFDEGVVLDRPVVVHAPRGYVLADSTPTPDAVESANVTWQADTSLDGFRAVFEPEPQQPGRSTGFGFDPLLAVAGAGALVALALGGIILGRG